MPRRIGLLPGEWPQVDHDLWERAITATDFFDACATASHWRPTTRKQAGFAYGRWLAFVKAEAEDALADPPALRATPCRLERYARQLQGRISDMGVAAELQHLLLALRAIAPQGEWTRLEDLQAAFQRRARPRDKRSKMVDPRELLDLGMHLMDSAAACTSTMVGARQFRDGLLLALLVSRPLRRGDLSRLTLGSSVRELGDRFTLELRPEDTKSGRPIEFDVPERLTPYLERYLREFRPLFQRATTHRAFWPSSKGGALTADAIYQLVCRRTQAAFGAAIHPHLFRDIAATAIAREAPGSATIARDLLAHANLETTQHYYTRAQSLQASRRYAEILAETRDRRPHSDILPTDRQQL